MRAKPYQYFIGAVTVAALACHDSVSPGPAMRESGVPMARSTAAILFGPERFERKSGAPSRYARQITTEGYRAPFELVVRPSSAPQVASARVSLSGKEILVVSDFPARDSVLRFGIDPGNAVELTVELQGAPGSYLEISITGERANTLYCSSSTAGAFTDLSAAIAAAPENGTVEVCDGVHDVDDVLVNKPVTLRSQNHGGATLRDSDPTVGHPNNVDMARPAIRIAGIASGTVRIADLTFEPRNRAILVRGQYDRVEIDSVRFIGQDSTLASGIAVRTNDTDPSGTVSIARSEFSRLYFAVWAAFGNNEVNVTHSRFERIHHGAIVYAGGRFPGGQLTASRGRVEDNWLIGCHNNGCIRAVIVSDIVIAGNRIEHTGSPAQWAFGMLVNRIDHASASSPVVIEDNLMIAPDARAGNSGAPAHIRFGIAAGDVTALGFHIRRNRLVHVDTAFRLGNRGRVTDNIVEGARLPIYALSGDLVVSFNDFLEAEGSVSGDSRPDFRCNWWGSISGPLNPAPHIPSVRYTPWAVAPIAQTDHSSCNVKDS